MNNEGNTPEELRERLERARRKVGYVPTQIELYAIKSQYTTASKIASRLGALEIKLNLIQRKPNDD